jgi:hypothetical protein
MEWFMMELGFTQEYFKISLEISQYMYWLTGRHACHATTTKFSTFWGRNFVERCSEFLCTKSLNVEIVSTIPTMEIKVWKVCFYGFFAKISQET